MGVPLRRLHGRFVANPDGPAPGVVHSDGMLRGTNALGLVTSSGGFRAATEESAWEEAAEGPTVAGCVRPGAELCRRGQGGNEPRVSTVQSGRRQRRSRVRHPRRYLDEHLETLCLRPGQLRLRNLSGLVGATTLFQVDRCSAGEGGRPLATS
jgi:hypothetical protein